MKDWLVSDMGNNKYWLTRIEVLSNGKEDYICSCCDGSLENHVVAFFGSSKGFPGSVASSICWKCDLLLGYHELPCSELDAKVELLLSPAENH